LQKTGYEKFALELQFFVMNPQEGIGCLSASLRRGPDGQEFWLQGTMLKVASVSTKCLSLVSLSVRKIHPALAGKCIAVAVACVGMATEPKGVWWLVSFSTKHRMKHSCEPCGRNNCEIYRCHWQGFEMNKNQGGKGATFRAGVAALLSPRFLLLGAGLLLR
jgi:hypothetical protein